MTETLGWTKMNLTEADALATAAIANIAIAEFCPSVCKKSMFVTRNGNETALWLLSLGKSLIWSNDTISTPNSITNHSFNIRRSVSQYKICIRLQIAAKRHDKS